MCACVLEKLRKRDCACERRAKGMNDRGSREGERKQGRDKVSRLLSCDVEQLPVSAKGQRCSCLPSLPSHSLGSPGPFPSSIKHSYHSLWKRYSQITNHFEWVKIHELWRVERKDGAKLDFYKYRAAKGKGGNGFFFGGGGVLSSNNLDGKCA